MKTALILDFDGVLFNLDALRGRNFDFWRHQLSPSSVAKFEKYLAEYNSRRLNCPTLFEPRAFMTSAEFAKYEQFIREVGERYVFADAAEFVAKLDFTKFQPIILTFGDRDLQLAEIAATPFAKLPTIITGENNKVEMLRGWWKNEFYEINRENLVNVMLIDDQKHNFVGFDELPAARGWWLNRHAPDDDEETGAPRGQENKVVLPDNVQRAKSFHEIMLDF